MSLRQTTVYGSVIIMLSTSEFHSVLEFRRAVIVMLNSNLD